MCRLQKNGSTFNLCAMCSHKQNGVSMCECFTGTTVLHRFATCQDKWTWPEHARAVNFLRHWSRRSGQVLPSLLCVEVPWLPHRWIPLTTTRSILWSATAWRQTQQLCSASAPQADHWEILGTSLPWVMHSYATLCHSDQKQPLVKP